MTVIDITQVEQTFFIRMFAGGITIVGIFEKEMSVCLVYEDRGVKLTNQMHMVAVGMGQQDASQSASGKCFFDGFIVIGGIDQITRVEAADKVGVGRLGV